MSQIHCEVGAIHSLTLDDGCVLRSRRIGSGPRNLILIHGFAEHNFTWGEVPSEISLEYTLIAIDLRGHGDSSWDRDGAYNLAKLAADVAETIKSLGIARFSLVGHSLGADVALEVAAAFQLSVDRLILVEFALEPIPEEVRKYAQSQFDAQYREYSTPTEYFDLLRLQRPLADAATLRKFADNSLKTTTTGVYVLKCDPSIRQLQSPELQPSLIRQRRILANLPCPCLLVRGSGSALVRQRAAENVVKLSRRAECCSVKGAGHAVMIDRPQQFYAAIARFLLSDLTAEYSNLSN
jgi:pimeloyl-ACP methyl ester carboxylesterase